MKVRAKKGTRKLIKGHIYETDFFNNDNSIQNNSYRYNYGRISIPGIGYFYVSDFTQVSGQDLPIQVYDNRTKKEPIRITDLKKGDVVVCLSDNRFKYLIEGGKYRISDIRVTNASQTWSGGSIKLEGYNRWLAWNNWNFRRLSLQESRDLSLSQIFDKEENFSVEFKRKFEQKSNKDKVLLEALAKSILDRYRHELDVVDWAIEKTGGHLHLQRKDFEELLDKPLKDILAIFDK